MAHRARSALAAFLMSVVAVVAAVSLVATTAGTAAAATGVRGHLDQATIVSGYCYGGPNPCYYQSKITVSGWAYNPYTVPEQEVRFVVSGPAYRVCGTFCSPYYLGWKTVVSGKVVASRCRTDVKRAYGLSYCDVGYATSFLTTQMWGGGTTVCAQARDRGSSQAWRGVGCRTANVYWA